MALKLNPLRGVDSLGKAIGLQTKFKNDYSGNKVVEDAFARRAAKEKEEKDLFSPLDVKIDTTKVEPYWAEKIQNEVAKYGSIYARAKGLNKDNAFAMVQPAYAQMQSNISGWLRSNEEFGKYKTQGEGHYKNSELITKVRTPGAKDEEVLAFNEKIGNVQITPEGMFSYEPVKQYVKSPDFKPEDFTEMAPERVNSPIPGYYQTRTGKVVTPGAYQNKIEQVMQDPEFQASIVMEFPELKNADANTKRAKVAEMAKVYVDAKMPPTTYKYDDPRIPTSSGSGSDKDKREKPIIVLDSPQSIMIQSDEMEDVPNYDEKGVEIGTKKQFKMKPAQSFMALSTAIPNVPAMTIPLDERVIDAKTNRYLKGDQLSQNVTFKPDMVYTEFIKKTGKWEKYVMGTATINVEKSGDIVTQKILTYKMPYDKVKSTIEGKYDMTEFDEKFGSLPPPRKAGGTNQPEAPKSTAQPTTQPTTQSNDYIDSILDFENKKGYSNYGFTSYSGSLNKAQAKDKFKKEYEPIVRDLPAPLQATAGDFAFNSEDPRASLMVAAGVITPSEKGSLYSNGKLDKAKVENLWKQKDGLNTIKKLYNKNPSAFLDSFDNERLRSYKNTNGADVKFDEWEERVAVSRGAANKLLNTKSAQTKTVIAPNNSTGVKPEM